MRAGALFLISGSREGGQEERGEVVYGQAELVSVRARLPGCAGPPVPMPAC